MDLFFDEQGRIDGGGGRRAARWHGHVADVGAMGGSDFWTPVESIGLQQVEALVP
jgi:hypothetical protein